MRDKIISLFALFSFIAFTSLKVTYHLLEEYSEMLNWVKESVYLSRALFFYAFMLYYANREKKWWLEVMPAFGFSTLTFEVLHSCGHEFGILPRLAESILIFALILLRYKLRAGRNI